MIVGVAIVRIARDGAIQQFVSANDLKAGAIDNVVECGIDPFLMDVSLILSTASALVTRRVSWAGVDYQLDRRGRIEEIARMLTGAEITESARRHARELLKT